MNKAKYLNDVLTSMESEEIIAKKLIEVTLDSVGSGDFIQHHTNLNKLNMQVVKNLLTGSEDHIMEQFVYNDKIKPLIKELFVINFFKSMIYPKIKKEIAELSSIKAYICIYHEACVVNILENFFYSVTACQAADDYIIDMIEYCYRSVSQLVKDSNKKPEKAKKTVTEVNLNEGKMKLEIPPVDELDQKLDEIEFNISMCCISILRYISDHLENLPFPVRHHMMNVKDIPLLLVAIMELKPWVKYKEGTLDVLEIFDNNQWTKLSQSAMQKIPKLEAQVWLTIFNLFMNQDNSKKYEITEYRKAQLLRLRKYLNDQIFDQIPPLAHFYRALEEMALVQYGNTPTYNPFIVEMVPILSGMFKYTDEELQAISEKIISQFFKIGQSSLRQELECMNEIYNIDNIEYFMEDPKCASCGKDATSRCSKCKSEWYCGKECQIKRWKQHKDICKALVTLYAEEKEEEKKKLSSGEMQVDNSAVDKKFEELD